MTTAPEKSDFDELDIVAIDRAIEMTLADNDRTVRAQLRDELKSSWWEAARFAAHHCQYHHLALRTWEEPPCDVDPDEIDRIIARGPASNAFGGARLLKRMLAAGLSRFDPTPIESLEAVKRGR